MKLSEIAGVAHEVNRAYSQSLGDDSHLPWDQAPAWQVASACSGVEHLILDPLSTPEQLHEAWCARKLEDGWVYGETKDEVAKTHPCLQAYSNLLPEQRTKDALFRATVRALLPQLDA